MPLQHKESVTTPNWGEHTDKLMREWDVEKNAEAGLDMLKITKGSCKTIWWKCSVDSSHSWASRMDNRTRIRSSTNLNNGCPFCSGVKVLVGFNDLGSSSVYEHITAEWHPTLNDKLTPQDVTVNSGKKVWWECSIESSHVWQARIISRVNLGRGCPVCANQKVVAGFNDLGSAVGFEKIVSEWHPTLNGELTPQNVTPFSRKTAWWKCSKNDSHVWNIAISDRTVKGSGCSKCSSGKTELAFMETFYAIAGIRLVSEKIELYRASRKTNRAQIDGHNQELMLAVEYDGYFPHSGTASGKPYSEIHSQDCETTEALLKAGYKVVRIRETARAGQNLTDLILTDENLLQVSYKSSGKAEERDDIEDVVKSIIALKPEWFIKS